MKIAVCGSMKFYEEIRAVKDTLEVLGHEAILPTGIENEIPVEARDVTEEEKVIAKIEYDFIREHFRKIDEADAILVLNFPKNNISGYIGGNTFLEMGHAFGLGKKIYLLNPVPEMNYSTEMHAMQPIILNGDLSAIG
jgi:nucleoside 2-deoxyribosyltransferase